MAFTGSETQISSSYAQLYRNGIIESVDTYLLRPHEGGSYIPSGIYESRIISSLSSYIALLQRLHIEPPIFIYLSLVGVKDHYMAAGDRVRDYPIGRDSLVFPGVLIQDLNEKPEYILKPNFDALWNACGFERSFNYNSAGEWIGNDA